MGRLFQWVLFIFSLFLLALFVRYYTTYPGAIFEFDKAGLYRLALALAIAIACVLMAVGFARRRRASSDAGSHEGRGVPRVESLLADLPASAEHPFKTAFRRRPVVATLLVAFPISLPFLFQLLPSEPRQPSEAAYWHSVLIGELLVGAVLATAWYRVKYLVRRRRNSSASRQRAPH